MLGVEAPRHQRVLLHALEAVGEDVGRDAGQALQEILEPARPPEEIADQQEGPAVADHLERLRDRTRLTVALGHDSILASA
jgi:ribosomal protein S7